MPEPKRDKLIQIEEQSQKIKFDSLFHQPQFSVDDFVNSKDYRNIMKNESGTR